MQRETDEASQIDAVVHRLGERFPDIDPPVIEAAVSSSLRDLAAARVRDFVPVLAERSAKQKLRLQASA
ncbi:hypothetical protein LQ938_11045 [Microbacterium sp. cx-55]|uniref:three-helix bundle dimerization domain-containing protein n=1 Tax=unclassified Microbacterium TaxID=2609290 RepID=UPI001CC0A32D|nr:MULTISPECIES: hypothetical protein [unclassified Microbacterium]MBZ4488186.1 hypothetical protein [Microbacterium sp. cx-55]MCC4908807.1 hypothetical protein [Microbacterium sp. cx-59]UGB34407.1 hypothetical protein LQ938_11045 [Microbacterium sp. cx-55]